MHLKLLSLQRCLYQSARAIKPQTWYVEIQLQLVIYGEDHFFLMLYYICPNELIGKHNITCLSVICASASTCQSETLFPTSQAYNHTYSHSLLLSHTPWHFFCTLHCQRLSVNVTPVIRCQLLSMDFFPLSMHCTCSSLHWYCQIFFPTCLW